MSDESEPKSGPTPESTQQKVILEVNDRLKEAEAAGAAAISARKRADGTTDPEEKKRTLEEADKQDKKSKSAIKIAQRLQSGVWQGGASGAGIGAGIGLGLGTVVGSVVGGVTAIPTTGLGALVGAGTGAVHGPWVKLKGDKEEEKEGPGEEEGKEGKGEE